MKKNIIVYRDSLLPISETFVKGQAENLERFIPYYAGYKRVQNGLSLPSGQVIVNSDNESNRNTISEVMMKKTSWNPRLTKMIKHINPKLIHAHFGPDGVIASSFAKRLNIPLITTFHGYDVTVRDNFLLDQSFNVRNYVKNKKTLMNEGTRFIAVSNFIKKKLIDQGFPSQKILTHYIGVNLDLLKPDPSIEREDIILFVGRLVENKGCEYLISAFKNIKDSYPHLKLVIIGEGPLKAHLVKESTGIDQIEFLGKRPYSEVIQWLNKSRIFCVPSIEIETGASEGFGMVFAEASAMGTPVVSFSTGGIPEAVKHGETGLLAKSGNTRELSNHLKTLLNDEILWKKYSQKGMNRIASNFDLKKQTSLLEQIYEEVLGEITYKN